MFLNIKIDNLLPIFKKYPYCAIHKTSKQSIWCEFQIKYSCYKLPVIVLIFRMHPKLSNAQHLVQVLSLVF